MVSTKKSFFKKTIISLFLITAIFLSANTISDSDSSSFSFSNSSRIYSASTTNSPSEEEEQIIDLPARHLIIKVPQWELIRLFVLTQIDVQLAIGLMIISLLGIFKCVGIGEQKIKKIK